MYLLNGLNEKFDNIINVIKHKDPFPTFVVAKSMLEIEESRIKKSHRSTTTHSDHSSSTTALTVAASSSTTPSTHLHDQQPRQYNQNNRGRGRNNRRGGGGRAYKYQPNYNWAPPPYWAAPPPSWSGPAPPWSNYYGNWAPYSHSPYRPPSHLPQERQIQQAHLTEIQPSNDTTATLPDPHWIMDSGATAHLSSTAGSSNPDSSSPM